MRTLRHSWVIVNVEHGDPADYDGASYPASVSWYAGDGGTRNREDLGADGAYDVHNSETDSEALVAAAHGAVANMESGIPGEEGAFFEYGFVIFDGKLVRGFKAVGGPVVWGYRTGFRFPLIRNARVIELGRAELRKLARVAR